MLPEKENEEQGGTRVCVAGGCLGEPQHPREDSFTTSGSLLPFALPARDSDFLADKQVLDSGPEITGMTHSSAAVYAQSSPKSVIWVHWGSGDGTWRMLNNVCRGVSASRPTPLTRPAL